MRCYTLLLAGILVLQFGSLTILRIEDDAPGANITTASDALWYTIVTISTVGYGDQYPVTNAGRVVGSMIIVVGVGIFGTFTGYLANLFLAPRKKAPEPVDDARPSCGTSSTCRASRSRTSTACSPCTETARHVRSSVSVLPSRGRRPRRSRRACERDGALVAAVDAECSPGTPARAARPRGFDEPATEAEALARGSRSMCMCAGNRSNRESWPPPSRDAADGHVVRGAVVRVLPHRYPGRSVGHHCRSSDCSTCGCSAVATM